MTFSNRLISWYLENRRDLPWRNTTDPYVIWLSEIILQQTRVVQGLPYFEAFISEFPTVFDLAQAQEEQVLKLWQGLGYYSRARNLHQTAQQVVVEFGGVFPSTYNALISLKGIGPYTAAAVASFSSNEAVPVVDGNVYRVLSRFFGLETDITSSRSRKEFTDLAFEVMDKKRASDFNQAIMEFGALQCVPKSPNCLDCIFNDSCWAFQNDKVALLPVKSQKVKIKNRFFNYLVVFDSEDATLIQKRTQKGIWHNLYEFPLIESEKELNEKEIKERVTTQFPEFQSMNLLVAYEDQSRLHKLSHQHLYIRFWRLEILSKLNAGISKKEAIKKPFPAVVFNFIENYF